MQNNDIQQNSNLIDKKVNISENENLPQGEEVSFLDLIDKVKTVTTIPTYIPKILSQQVVVYVDSITTPTVKRLYIYADRVGVWYYITLT